MFDAIKDISLVATGKITLRVAHLVFMETLVANNCQALQVRLECDRHTLICTSNMALVLTVKPRVVSMW